MECIGESCKKCGCTTKITQLFNGKSDSYYCKCNHPANKNIFTKLLWKLNGKPAMKLKKK